MRKLIAVALFAFAVTCSWAGDYAVIVNKGNSESSISKATLKRIYTGRIKQFGGQKVIPMNLPGTNATAAAFLSEIVKMSPEDYKSFWVEQQIKGKGTPPMEQKTVAAVKLMVAR